jgi:hypothetical protein
LRDRALIGLMVYFFARIGVALGRMVHDVCTQDRCLSGCGSGKGGKRHSGPCPNFEEYLTTYLI